MIAQLRSGKLGPMGEKLRMLPLHRACALLSLPRSLVYRKAADTSLSRAEDAQLLSAIETIVLAFPGYGYRRVTKQLARDGWTANGKHGVDVNHKRAARLMRANGLSCRAQRRWIATTQSSHGHRIWPNLAKKLERSGLSGLNQLWVADITYIRLPNGFCYLACILDAFSRRVIGWELARFLDARLALGALSMALAARCPKEGKEGLPSGLPNLVHHSDRGVQYACDDYVSVLLARGIQVSMSAKGTPRDNAKAESFFRTLKVEEVYLCDYLNFEEALLRIERFLEEVYNQKRLHSSLGYLPPKEFEASLPANFELSRSTQQPTAQMTRVVV
jgi:putative transposase